MIGFDVRYGNQTFIKDNENGYLIPRFEKDDEPAIVAALAEKIVCLLYTSAQTSTGLGDGIAMPHSKNAAVKEATVLFAKSNKGVDYESLDGQSTDLFFMIAAPEGANDKMCIRDRYWLSRLS